MRKRIVFSVAALIAKEKGLSFWARLSCTNRTPTHNKARRNNGSFFIGDRRLLQVPTRQSLPSLDARAQRPRPHRRRTQFMGRAHQASASSAQVGWLTNTPQHWASKGTRWWQLEAGAVGGVDRG